MNHNKSATYMGDDFQYIAGYGDGAIWEKSGKVAGISMATSPVSGGYAVEIRVPWSTLGKVPGAGATYGFDIGVNDDDDGGDRNEQIMWFGTSQNFADTSAFGNVTLGPPCP